MDGDIHVFKIDRPEKDDLEPAFFAGSVVGVTREPSDVDGEQVVSLTFENGGKIQIFTSLPLIWIEPERH